MDIEVKIDKEKIEQSFISAVLESALGDKIQKAVMGAMKAKYPAEISPVEQAVNEEVMRTVRVIVREHYQEEVRRMFDEAWDPERIKEAVGQAFDRFANTLSYTGEI